jgi:hypothetical protein
MLAAEEQIRTWLAGDEPDVAGDHEPGSVPRQQLELFSHRATCQPQVVTDPRVPGSSGFHERFLAADVEPQTLVEVLAEAEVLGLISVQRTTEAEPGRRRNREEDGDRADPDRVGQPAALHEDRCERPRVADDFPAKQRPPEPPEVVRDVQERRQPAVERRHQRRKGGERHAEEPERTKAASGRRNARQVGPFTGDEDDEADQRGGGRQHTADERSERRRDQDVFDGSGIVRNRLQLAAFEPRAQSGQQRCHRDLRQRARVE